MRRQFSRSLEFAIHSFQLGAGTIEFDRRLSAGEHVYQLGLALPQGFDLSIHGLSFGSISQWMLPEPRMPLLHLGNTYLGVTSACSGYGYNTVRGFLA